MGRVFKVEYDQNTDVPYYVCRHCGTEIAKDRDRYLTNLIGVEPAIYFETADNLVVADEESYRTETTNTVADVNCVQCNSLFGYKIIRLGQGGNVNFIGPRVRTFALFVAKLLKWDGADVLAADAGLVV